MLKSLVKYDEQKLLKAEIIPKNIFEMEISEGKCFYDIIGYQDTSNFAISKKLYDLLVENKISGWKGYEISIKKQNQKYYGFQVTGKCGKLEKPNKIGFYIGYKFDYNTWDKSDFFSPENTMLVFCTDKVQKLFIKHKITNSEIININNIKGYSFGC